MGFSSLIDILGSIVVGGLLFMILLKMNDTAIHNTYEYTGELTVQQNLVEVVQLIEYDFRKIGYCADMSQIVPERSILYADTSNIKFITDISTPGHSFGDGTFDTLNYYVGAVNQLKTPNKKVRKLYRVVNSETPRSANLGITEFKILYFDSQGDTLSCPVTNPGEIQTMQINVKVENPYTKENLNDTSSTGGYSGAFWRQIRMAARNLKNR